MKTNLIVTLCIIPVLCILFCVMQGCSTPDLTTSKDKLKEITVVEEGILDGYSYKMFQDPKTGQRILFYKGAMAVLPPEKPELK
jgi:hypothetical protein